MTEYTLNRWTLPSHYAGAEWPEHFVFLGRNRDSDDLTESNFACGLRAIGGESDTVRVVRESHWACGWIEWIAIHESDESALAIARELIRKAKAWLSAARAWGKPCTAFGYGAKARCLMYAAIYRRALAHNVGIKLSPMT